MNPTEPSLREVYDLALENNRMLHAMRRSAFLGGMMKFVFWALILGSSVWAYMQFLNPMLTQALNTLQQVQGTSAKIQGQISGPLDTLKQLQNQFLPKQ